MLTSLNLGRLGRFANQMFTIAGVIGVATKCGNTYGFPQWINHDHKERFGSTEDVDVYKHFVNQLPPVSEGPFAEISYFWGYMDLNYPNGDFSFNAHFQSQKYFDHCIKDIRHYFTMTDEKNYPGTVAVHMRFGDYDDNYHPRPRVEYYREALEKVPGDVLLFSDDLKAASDVMQQLTRTYTPVDGDYLDNFRIMKGCSHFITGNSSYSLMASILGPDPDKIIVCPRKFFGPAWGNPEEMAKDIYPFNSIVI